MQLATESFKGFEAKKPEFLVWPWRLLHSQRSANDDMKIMMVLGPWINLQPIKNVINVKTFLYFTNVVIKTSFLKLCKVVYSGVFFVDYRINVICVRINGFNSIREFLLICSKFCGIFSTDSGDFKALQFLYCSILSKQLILRIIFKQFQHVWSGSFW